MVDKSPLKLKQINATKVFKPSYQGLPVTTCRAVSDSLGEELQAKTWYVDECSLYQCLKI